MQKRIILAALLSVIAILVGLGIVSNISVQDEVEHSLDQSLQLASVVASYTDYLLQSNMARLYDVSLSGRVDFTDGDWGPERKALELAYQYSIFSDGLFLLDSQARIVLSHPHAQVTSEHLSVIADLKQVLEGGKPVISGVHTLPDAGRRALFAFAPLTDRFGRPVGAIGGEIDPTSRFFRETVRPVDYEIETVIELVDLAGVVIASSNPDRVFLCSDRGRYLGDLITTRREAVFQCHRCHQAGENGADSESRTTDVMAFSPLQGAPWGVVVREPQEHILAPSTDLRRRFLVLALIVLTSTVLLALALSRSIVSPIQRLIEAAKRIADGRLSEPVGVTSRDEIGTLGESFETMRVKLAKSVARLRRSNVMLESRVEERTQELRRQRERLSSLLHRVMNAQEEERMRIARELHDETIQSASALGLSLEIASMALDDGKLATDELLKLKQDVDRLIDGINGLIRDLRPPMLDDLGLESAVRWLLDRHLGKRGIRYHLEYSQAFKKQLGRSHEARLELTLFRIIQEAVINIAKHSEATLVSLALLAGHDHLQLRIQDDGVGFDAEQALEGGPANSGSGWGLLGLRERAALLGGELDLRSTPGEGTTLTVTIPIGPTEEDHAGQSDDSG